MKYIMEFEIRHQFDAANPEEAEGYVRRVLAMAEIEYATLTKLAIVGAASLYGCAGNDQGLTRQRIDLHPVRGQVGTV